MPGLGEVHGDADDDQPFHCDFANHTFTVPSEDITRNPVTIPCCFSDVTEAHGPMHFVPRTECDAGPEEWLLHDAAQARALQARLAPRARASASPAGSVFPYAIDVFHRGTNLTAPGVHRFALMTCLKRAGDEAMNFTAWPFHHTRPWRNINEHGTPEQLACFGVQPPAMHSGRSSRWRAPTRATPAGTSRPGVRHWGIVSGRPPRADPPANPT